MNSLTAAVAGRRGVLKLPWPIFRLNSLMYRAQHSHEEIANSLVHGMAALLSVLALVLLLIRAVQQQAGAAMISGVVLFGGSLILLYSASTLCHALTHKKAKYVFEVLDHCFIFLLIAGTYSPILLGVIGGSLGWALFAIVWLVALAGILMKAIRGPGYRPMLSNLMYLGMGWLIVFAIGPLVAAMPPDALNWLVAGGLAYSLGVVFFVLDHRFHFAHFVWHLFVVAGSACHVLAVYLAL